MVELLQVVTPPSIVNLHPLNQQFNNLKLKYFDCAKNYEYISRSFFQQLNLKDDTSVLDLGCFFGGVWCENDKKLNRHESIIIGDEHLIHVRLTQQNLKRKNLNYPVELMDLTQLRFSNNTFDRVMSCLWLEKYDINDLIKMIEECYRVSAEDGVCYFFMHNSSPKTVLNKLLLQFDSNLDIPMSMESLKRQKIELVISQKFKHIEYIDYDTNSIISSVELVPKLLTAIKHPIFIESVVKTHRMKEFSLFLKDYIQQYGPIQLNSIFSLIICHKKNQKCH